MTIWQWVGTSVVGLIANIVLSNTFYLLVGSRLLQYLPGVNIRGFSGTMKIAAMLISAGCGIMWWAITRPVRLVGLHLGPADFKQGASQALAKGSRSVGWVLSKCRSGELR